MTSIANRGRLKVRESSWHYRVHAWWAKQKGLEPKPTDLCHYFWRVMLWAPLRFFFTKGPAYLLAAAAIIAFAVYAGIMWGREILDALRIGITWIVIAVIIGIAVTSALYVSIRLAFGWHPPVVKRRAKRLGVILVWPAELLFEKDIFGIPPIAIVVLGGYGVWVWHDSYHALIVLGLALAALVGLFAVIAGGVALLDRRSDRKLEQELALEHARSQGLGDPPAHQRWSGLRTIWAFLRAKKERVCPLIEVDSDVHSARL